MRAIRDIEWKRKRKRCSKECGRHGRSRRKECGVEVRLNKAEGVCVLVDSARIVRE
jgi:hypothetical protein